MKDIGPLTDIHILDIPATYAELDPSGMGARLLSLADQSARGWELGGRVDREAIGTGISRVLVVGMGGSAIGGEMIKGLADAQRGSCQIATWREYGVPGWVDESTLVAAVSVSGATAETRSAFAAAGEAGARRVAVSGAGPLRGEAVDAGVPTVDIDWTGEPRAALGFTFVAPLAALASADLLLTTGGEFREAVDSLRDVADDLSIEKPVEENAAKQIAIELGNRMPIVYGSGHLLGVAMRWKTQFNENANSWAGWEALPEVGHNVVQSYLNVQDEAVEPYVLMLKPEKCSQEISEAIDVHGELLSADHTPNLVLELAAPNLIGEILAGALMGDMISYYLALLRGQDPSLTANIDAIKARQS